MAYKKGGGGGEMLLFAMSAFNRVRKQEVEMAIELAEITDLVPRGYKTERD